MPYELKHRTTKTVEKGTHFPLGATLTPEGVNFAIYSKNATEVFLMIRCRTSPGFRWTWIVPSGKMRTCGRFAISLMLVKMDPISALTACSSFSTPTSSHNG